ncbi:hypothetical protein ABF87_04030 [Nitrosomonas sp. JL21]|uniref:DUF6164 family protein n=1 Tax=Nitrosomonas sp. JL21 TaxID=153949 RepID=UPI00136F39D3|nr:DUF6164 family protein [Nitrosomonas sp. JL21]MBL8497272.1 hypothetical protein [Nitrosomonas sp.]MCC7091727.1 hypothetical protein [Nitrosomonas sp.]MXS77141.1 hypothetical protein [Nitrosomonas sp. JL21]
MAKILFRLQNVSDDEANDVRELLIDNAIDFYETSGGNWGVSMPAIWLKDDDQFPRARALLDAYQDQRTTRMRKEYAQLKREGRNKSLIDSIIQRPVSFMIHLALALLVLYLSTKLVLDLFP